MNRETKSEIKRTIIGIVLFGAFAALVSLGNIDTVETVEEPPDPRVYCVTVCDEDMNNCKAYTQEGFNENSWNAGSYIDFFCLLLRLFS